MTLPDSFSILQRLPFPPHSCTPSSPHGHWPLSPPLAGRAHVPRARPPPLAALSPSHRHQHLHRRPLPRLPPRPPPGWHHTPSCPVSLPRWCWAQCWRWLRPRAPRLLPPAARRAAPRQRRPGWTSQELPKVGEWMERGVEKRRGGLRSKSRRFFAHPPPPPQPSSPLSSTWTNTWAPSSPATAPPPTPSCLASCSQRPGLC